MKFEFEITERQAWTAIALMAIAFLIGTAVGAADQKERMEDSGWIGPDDWMCVNGPINVDEYDGGDTVYLFNDSQSFEECAKSTGQRIEPNPYLDHEGDTR